jgi:hypothetical protein
MALWLPPLQDSRTRRGIEKVLFVQWMEWSYARKEIHWSVVELSYARKEIGRLGKQLAGGGGCGQESMQRRGGGREWYGRTVRGAGAGRL